MKSVKSLPEFACELVRASSHNNTSLQHFPLCLGHSFVTMEFHPVIAIIYDGEAVYGRQMSDVALVFALGQGRQDVFEGRCCRRVLEMGDPPIDVGSGGVELAGHSGLFEG